VEDRGIGDGGLEGPLSWRTDGAGFPAEIKRLAREFGYA
jgi:hypothetical protein